MEENWADGEVQAESLPSVRDGKRISHDSHAPHSGTRRRRRRLTTSETVGWIICGFVSGIFGFLVCWLTCEPNLRKRAMVMVAIGLLAMLVVSSLAVLLFGHMLMGAATPDMTTQTIVARD